MMTLRNVKLSITTHSVMKLSIMTTKIMALSTLKLSITTLIILKLSITNDTQYIDIQLIDTQHNLGNFHNVNQHNEI